jgi:hypothetical protein
MLAVAQAGTPLDIPSSVHLALWPALIAWVLILLRLRRTHPGLRSTRLGVALFPVTMLADGAAVAASHIWATPAATPLVFAALWVAVLLSVTTYLILRAPDDGDDGGGPGELDPEPPWWPEFERRLRDYTRGHPRGTAGRPRTPAGISS